MMNPCHICNCLHSNGSCSIYHHCNKFRGWFAREWRNLQMIYGVIEKPEAKKITKDIPKGYKGNTFTWRIYQEGGFFYD